MVLSKMARRFALACTATLFAAGVLAQQYPSKPIKILVGYAPGGGTDTVARVYAAKLQEELNAPVVVENRPGAGEIVAAQATMNAAPDGYTLFVTTNALTLVPGVRNDLPYDPLKSFTHISRVADGEAVFAVKSSLPVNSVAELIAYAKANPDKLSYGSAGVGISNHLMIEYLKMMTGTRMTHVPYKSDSDMVRDLIGGGIDLALTIGVVGVPFAADGRIKPVGVTGADRFKALPHVPSLNESGLKELNSLGVYAAWGLVGPAGMSPAVTQKLADAVKKVAGMPAVAASFDKLYVKPHASSPDEYRQFIDSEVTRWRMVGKRLNLH